MEPANTDIPDALRWAAFSFKVDRVTAEVTTALTVASIESILLKGPAIATWLYSGDRTRVYTDTDLLIQKRDWNKAMNVMKGLGFEDNLAPLAHPRMESGSGYPWGRLSDGADVDLHYTLFGIGATPGALWTAFSKEAVREPLGGVEVSMPCHAARLLHIALHSVQHGGEEKKTTMDLEQAVAKAPQETWLEAWKLAEQLYAGEAFTAGLRLLPEGRKLADTIGAIQDHSAGTALRLEWVPTAEGFQELAETPKFRGKLTLVARELFPNSTFMRWWTPLARRGALGLAAAYVWRLIWLSFRVIPGFLAWRRAVRSGARGY